jgi:type I restriction enzyme S subunit
MGEVGFLAVLKMKFPAYPKCKPSGVEWLGDVPDKWDVKRLKYIAERSDVKIEADPEAPVPYIGLEHLESWTGKLLPLDLELVPSGIANRFKKGNVLFGKLRPYLAKACTPDFTGLCSTELLVLEASKQDSRFLRYGLLTRGFVSLVDSASYGVKMPRASWDFIGVCSLPVPPLPEQQAIADFLDAQTARLDALLTKRRALIEKLSEKRSALISSTVTRGLNPKAKLKPSGVEWLGDVPEHWKVLSLRYAFQNLDHRRIPVAGEERATMEKTFPYYGASGIIDLVEDYIFDETLILVAEDGANLLSRSTPLAFLASGKYWVNNHAHILKPLGGDIRYWVAVLQTFEYAPLVTGAAQPKLTSERLGSIKLPKPPVAEQIAIAEFLDRETAKLDQMMAKVEAAIGKLQEYRTALITAAVTGKIDVRKAAA